MDFTACQNGTLGNGTDGLLLHLALLVIIKLNSICESTLHILSAQLIFFLSGGKLAASIKVELLIITLLKSCFSRVSS